MEKRKIFVFFIFLCVVLLVTSGLYQYKKYINSKGRMFADSDCIKYMSKVNFYDKELYNESIGEVKNTIDISDFEMPNRRTYWDKVQTDEEHLGLPDFEPGEKESICYIDGAIKDWDDDTSVYEDNDVQLYVKSDEAYVYFRASSSIFDFQKDKLLIPIDVIENQGNSYFKGSTFSRDADFLIYIDGENKSQILIDPYYDGFQYLYAEKLGVVPLTKEYTLKNSGKFVPMYQALSREYYLPKEKGIVPFSKYKIGKLNYGNGNPKSSDYNSLADFCVEDNEIEIRIPWQLLNVMDPSRKKIMDDFHQSGISPIEVKGIYVGAVVLKNDNQLADISMKLYDWDSWEKTRFHERLKQSYYILKEELKKY